MRPILAEQCYECHSNRAKKLQANLYLDSREGVLTGGDSGAVIVPGNPSESLLVEAIRYESIEMPPRGKLKSKDIAALVKWVKMGAPWPQAPKRQPKANVDAFDWKQRRDNHWSWQSLQTADPPSVTRADWPHNPIDQFILAKLEDTGLQPAPHAQRSTLIRRLYFDLIGLPPSREEVRAFLSDDSADAYETLVEALLESQHFGEKWARHWLDLVRYAETFGHEYDFPIPHAFRYRDYVIRALNADLPYNQFVVEQIAGDLIQPPRRHPTDGYNESIIGTGFWFLGENVDAPTDVRGDEADRMDNQIDVLCKAVLGITIGCARCHDHKFDPIPTTDYYALVGFLQSSRRHEAMLDRHQHISSLAARLAELRTVGDELVNGLINEMSLPPEQFAAYLLAVQQVRELEQSGESADLVKNGNSQTIHQASAHREGLDPHLLAKWHGALEDESVQDAGHPLFAWIQLTSLADGAGETWEKKRLHWYEKVVQLQEQAEQGVQSSVAFADFGKGDYSDWYVTGEAFRAAPTTGQQWDWRADRVATLEAGLAHSGVLSDNLQGVIRSPTFTLAHSHIHYRLQARRIQLRLVIDGYVMNVFSPLLFNGALAKDVNTEHEFQWYTQSGDIGRYRGHRAHIEIIDHGDGFAAIDQVRFSNGAQITDPPSRLARRLVSDSRIGSAKGLARAYAVCWKQCLAAWLAGEVDADQRQLVGWVVENGLINFGPIGRALGHLRSQIRFATNEIPHPTRVLAITDGDTEDERIHIRGSHKDLGDVIPRRFLLAIAGENQPAVQGSGRMDLARRVTDPSNPFFSRVAVNRIWHQLFGRGIVPSVDDFGAMGDLPSHPELLDWLAANFLQNDCSIKQMIKAMVMSSTYRMASNPELADRNGSAADPTNRLLYRMPIHRLQSEAIRDSILSVSGRLDKRLFGSSVPVHVTSFMTGRGRPDVRGPLDGNGRRSIYLDVRRNFLSPMMLTFDTPIPFSTMGRRSVSNVPAQSLIMLNDPFVHQQAEIWAQRVLAEFDDVDQRLMDIFETALAHPPSDDQLQRTKQFLQQQAELYEAQPDDVRVWKDICHTLLNLKEFIFVN